jgi:DNA-binding NarL/FixJ family response regulator
MKVLVIDDHVLFREGLASIIRGADVEIVGLAGSVREAINAARELKPEVILMDYSLPDGTGAEAARAILKEQPECKIIFLTVSDEDETLFDAVRSGGKGYLLKNISPNKLISAVRSVHQGESALSRSMTLRVLQELARTDPPKLEQNQALKKLTARELDVLRELATGKTNQEIAQRLCVAENTVRYHMHSIFEKLELPDRRAAASFARENGLST